MKSRRNLDEERTLGVLIGWLPDPPPYPTPLVERCNKALGTEFSDLSAEQLRLMIGQQIGLEVLLPRAFEILRENPLVCVTLYDGDLLTACLRVDAAFWIEHPDLWRDLDGLLQGLDDTLASLNEARSMFGAGNPYQTS